MKRIAWIVALAPVLGGCTQTVWVTQAVQEDGKTRYEKVGGIPFYVKKEVYNQTTSYSQTWYKATLVVDTLVGDAATGAQNTPKPSRQVFEKRLLKGDLDQLDAIRLEIIGASSPKAADVQKLVKAFMALPDTADVAAIKPEMIGNEVKAQWTVSEERQYFLNAPLPWFGSGNLTQELSEDGTLSKVVANPETKLSEGLASLIPFKEYLTGKYVDKLDDDSATDLGAKISAFSDIPGGLGKAMIANKEKYQLVHSVSLSVDEEGYVYRFTRQHDSAPASYAPLAFDLSANPYSREVLSAEPPSDEKKKADDDNSIGLQGKISLPKGWGKE